MLYLAHCSFDEVGDEQYYGYFYYIVEAKNIEEAGDRLRKEISRMRQRSDLFDRAVKIYVEHFIEIPSLPKRGLLARYQSFRGEAPPVLFCPVPPGSARGCNVYQIRPEVEDNEQGDTVEPFMEFDAKHA